MTIDFVHGAAAVQDLAVDRDTVSGTNAEAVTDLDPIDWNLVVSASIAQAVGSLRRQVQQRADGPSGTFSGAQLQHLTEKNQHRDDRGRLIVNRDRAAHGTEAFGEDARDQGGNQAVEVGGARPQCDQGKHIEVAADDRGPAALEERPARPQHNRCGEYELDPHGDPRRHEIVQPQSRDMTAHLKNEHRQCQDQPDPATPGHVMKFVIGNRLRRYLEWFESHATDGAASWTALPDFRMHRAGVDGIWLHRPTRSGQVVVRGGLELRPASGGAEVECRSRMTGAMRGRGWVHLHPADGVSDGRRLYLRAAAAIEPETMVVIVFTHDVSPGPVANREPPCRRSTWGFPTMGRSRSGNILTLA